MRQPIFRSFFILLLLLGIASTLLAQDSINIGDTITGAAEGDDVEYTIELQSGDVIVIDLSSDDFDTLVKILDADGEELARNDDGGEGFNSLLTYEAEESGTYSIVVTSFFNNTNGEFTLSVTAGTPSGNSEGGGGASTNNAECGEASGGSSTDDIRVGETVTDEVDGTASFNITLDAGQTVVIALSSEDFDTYLELLDNRERPLDYDDDGGGDLNSRLIFTAEFEGEYIIHVRGYSGDAVGTFTLSVIENCGNTDGGSIEYGETVTLVPDGAFQLLVTFEGNEGDAINLYAVSSNDEDILFTLYDPDGNQIASDDDGGVDYNPALRRFVLPETGTYQLDIQRYDGGEMSDPIDLTLELTELIELSEEPTEVTMGEDLSTETFIFEARGDNRYLLVLEFEEDIDSTLYLDFLQESEIYAVTNFSVSGTSSFAAIFTADETGTIRVDLEYYGFSGDITFTIAIELLD